MGDLHKARARAEAFAHAVDSGSRHSVHGVDDPELATAVLLANRLRTVGTTVTPRPEFSVELRRRLLDAAAARAAAATPIVLHSGNELLEILDESDDKPAATATVTVTDLHYRSRKRLRLVAATAALVALGGGIGSAAAAQQAIPGDTLYGFKRSIETVATNVSVGDGSRGRRELGHAMTRLAEVRALTAEGADPSLLSRTLDDFSSQARRGVSRLVAAYQQDSDETSIDTVNGFIVDARSQLREITPHLPDGEAYRSGIEALTTIETLAAHAKAACPKCGRPGAQTSTAPTPSESPGVRSTPQPVGQPSPQDTTATQPPLVSTSTQPSTGPGQNQTPGQTTIGPVVPLPTITTHSPDPRKPTVRPSTPLPTIRPTTPNWPFPTLNLPTLRLPPWLTSWLIPRR